MGGRGSGNPNGGRSGGGARRAEDMASADAEVCSRVMALARDLFSFERPDLGDAASVEDAFYRYLEACARHGTRPMVKGLAYAFGMPSADLQRIAVNDPRYSNYKGGILTPESRGALTKSYEFLAVAWETFLVEERGNPVKWIFLGKNYFGMKDQADPVQLSIEVRPQLRAPSEVMAEYAAMVGHPRQNRLPDVIEIEAEVEEP